jgi:N-acetylmuramoyl-L-alanine amidase
MARLDPGRSQDGYRMPLYRLGASGPAVREIRARLAGLGFLDDAESDVFDAACDSAVRAFQQARALSADGIVGPETYRALDEARWRLGDRNLFHAVSHPFTGDDVAELQQRLLELGFDPGRRDGVFGRRTDEALRDFQRNVGTAVDGMCGPTTLKALARLVRTVVGGSPQQLRESEQLHRAGPSLAGKTIVLDPGHGGADRGAAGHGLEEVSVVEDVASRLEGRLAATGVRVYLTRGPDSAPEDADRADFANTVRAHLFVSLHADGCADRDARGVATYYYGWVDAGGRMGGSATGQQFARLVQAELVARTGLLDCRTHRKTWDLLRRTRMPAVRVELGYVTSPHDAARLADPRFRDTAAEALLAAIQRLYLPPELDAPTGQLRLPWLAGAPVAS